LKKFINGNDENIRKKIPHNLILDNRKILHITGVTEMGAFDEEHVTVYTDLGGLYICGNMMKISKLSVETNEMNLSGDILSLTYFEKKFRVKNFFEKIFG
jgi:sporulation protein YabP